MSGNKTRFFLIVGLSLSVATPVWADGVTSATSEDIRAFDFMLRDKQRTRERVNMRSGISEAARNAASDSRRSAAREIVSSEARKIRDGAKTGLGSSELAPRKQAGAARERSVEQDQGKSGSSPVNDSFSDTRQNGARDRARNRDRNRRK
jgi:hypothetical protein